VEPPAPNLPATAPFDVSNCHTGTKLSHRLLFHYQISIFDSLFSKRILKFLQERVARLDNPRSIGQALQGSKLGEFWKYRVGDYRLICKIEDNRLLILVLRVGHRREIYR
jgi:mRNA interferase RelE/StbE